MTATWRLLGLEVAHLIGLPVVVELQLHLARQQVEANQVGTHIAKIIRSLKSSTFDASITAPKNTAPRNSSR